MSDGDKSAQSQDNQKQSRNPKEAAVNKLREAKLKDLSGKIDIQVKKTYDAKTLYENEQNALNELVADYEEEKLNIAEFIKTL